MSLLKYIAVFLSVFLFLFVLEFRIGVLLGINQWLCVSFIEGVGSQLIVINLLSMFYLKFFTALLFAVLLSFPVFIFIYNQYKSSFSQDKVNRLHAWSSYLGFLIFALGVVCGSFFACFRLHALMDMVFINADFILDQRQILFYLLKSQVLFGGIFLVIYLLFIQGLRYARAS